MSVTRLNTPARIPEDSEIYNLGRGPETGIGRIRRLQAEAKALAREQVETFCRDLADLAFRAAEIAEGGEAFSPGVRELAARLAAELPDRAQTMLMISERIATGR